MTVIAISKSLFSVLEPFGWDLEGINTIKIPLRERAKTK